MALPSPLWSSAAAAFRCSSPQRCSASTVLSLFGAWFRLDPSITSALPRLVSAGCFSTAPALCRSASPLCTARRRMCSKPQVLHYCQFDVRSFLRSPARLRRSVLRAATGARSSRALRHSQFGARFFLRSTIFALPPLMRFAVSVLCSRLLCLGGSSSRKHSALDCLAF